MCVGLGDCCVCGGLGDCCLCGGLGDCCVWGGGARGLLGTVKSAT